MTKPLPLKNRQQAGHLLAQKLSCWRNDEHTVVLALPRGGVPVGFALAEALALPLDVLVVRQLGVPGHTELSMGAMSTDGHRLLSDNLLEQEKNFSSRSGSSDFTGIDRDGEERKTVSCKSSSD